MPNVKPFRFHLQKISRRQIELTEGLLDFLPRAGLKEDIQLAVRKALHRYLGDIGYYLERLEEISFKDFFHRLPPICCVAVLGLQPFSQKGFVEIDPELSHLLVEKLLSGKEEARAELRPLTETEQGVVEFLLLKCLAQIHKVSGEKAKLHFRLENMVLEAPHLRPLESQQEALVCLKFHLSFLKRSGFVHLYLPHPWVLEGFLKGLEQKEGAADWQPFSDFPCEVWGGLGQAEVAGSDLATLNAGDVVLFDQTGIDKAGDRWAGRISLCVGEGEHGSWPASWEGFQAQGRIRLQGNYKEV